VAADILLIVAALSLLHANLWGFLFASESLRRRTEPPLNDDASPNELISRLEAEEGW